MKRHSKYACPDCGYRLTWSERFSLTQYFGLARDTIACPQCHTPLCWRKWPWRIETIGSFAFLTVFFLFLWPHRKDDVSIHILLLTFYSAIIVVTMIARWTNRVIKADNSEAKTK